MTIVRKAQAPKAMVVATLFVILLGNGCNSSSKAEPTLTLTNVIGGVGSTFVDPLMKRWVLGFEQSHPQQGVNYRAEGSGAGIAEIKKSITEFAASDAPLSDEELKTMPAVLQVPVTAGPVCIIYNLPQLRAPLKLDGKTLTEIIWEESSPGMTRRSRAAIPGLACRKQRSLSCIVRMEAARRAF